MKRLQQLRRRFACGPVELAIPSRRILIVLDPEDVGWVLLICRLVYL
jgi:hypothetical protein